MENLIFLVIGILITLMITRKPIKVEVHHRYENVPVALNQEEMKNLEQGMLKEDPKEDDAYAKLGAVIQDVNQIMGGSDR